MNVRIWALWFSSLLRRLRSLLRQPRERSGVKILFDSDLDYGKFGLSQPNPYVRFLMLDLNLPPLGGRFVRTHTWRGILRHRDGDDYRRPFSDYECLITCDRILRTPAGEARRGKFRKLEWVAVDVATHRFCVALFPRRIGPQYPVKGLCLYLADIDCIGISGVFRGEDGFAPQIMSALIRYILKSTPLALEAFFTFDTEREHVAVFRRWSSLFKYILGKWGASDSISDNRLTEHRDALPPL